MLQWIAFLPPRKMTRVREMGWRPGLGVKRKFTGLGAARARMRRFGGIGRSEGVVAMLKLSSPRFLAAMSGEKGELPAGPGLSLGGKVGGVVLGFAASH